MRRIQQVIDYIQNNIGEQLSIARISNKVNLSETHLRRMFHDATGLSIHKFIVHLRLKKAHELLMTTDIPLIQISTALGFNSPSHFISVFKKSYSITPARYRKMFSGQS